MSRLALVLAFAISTLTSQAAPQATPGKWQMTTTMQMNGMSLPGNTVSFCIKPEDAANIQKQAMGEMPKGGKQDCKMVDQSISGNTVRYTMKCSGEQNMTVKGEMTYEGNSYRGKSNMEMQGMKMDSTIAAKRIGDC